MKKLLPCLMCATLLLGLARAQSQKTAASANSKKPPTSFTEKLLKFFGISESPGTLKGPGDEVSSGQVWLVDLQSSTRRALTSSDGYRSPIFLAGSNDVLALRGTEVVRVPKSGGEGKRLYVVDGILKLVASSSDDPSTVLILQRGDSGGHPRVGLLQVATGAVTPLPYNPASSQDLQMVEDLTSWSRAYGDRQVYVQRQVKQALSGKVEWSDVFLQSGDRPPVDVSKCDGVNCGQPSLSPDGRSLAFVKAQSE
jgi:Tol biopolymer transport system component